MFGTSLLAMHGNYFAYFWRPLASSDAKKKDSFLDRVFLQKQVFIFIKTVYLFFKYGININTQVETTLLWDL